MERMVWVDHGSLGRGLPCRAHSEHEICHHARSTSFLLFEMACTGGLPYSPAPAGFGLQACNPSTCMILLPEQCICNLRCTLGVRQEAIASAPLAWQ